MHFFEFSLEQFSENGYGLKNISLDLHNSGFEGNIVTEYEKRFSDMGMPIYRLEAYLR
jgi:tRNA (guanine-N7-)-methyltransferase